MKRKKYLRDTYSVEPSANHYIVRGVTVNGSTILKLQCGTDQNEANLLASALSVVQPFILTTT